METQRISAMSLRKISNLVNVNIDWILNRMLSEAEAGESSYHHYDTLTEKQKKELISRGFTIAPDEDNPEESYIIKW